MNKEKKIIPNDNNLNKKYSIHDKLRITQNNKDIIQ